MTTLVTAALVGSLGGLLGGVVPLAAPAASAEGSDCSNINSTDVQSSDSDAASLPAAELGFPQMARTVGGSVWLGEGVTVAVVDSGVADPFGRLRRVDGTNLTGKQEIVDWHGTAVAGLVTGIPQGDNESLPRGLAPAARVMDVRVYDSSVAEGDDKPVTTASVADGLEWILRRAPEVSVVVVPVSVPPSDRLHRVVKRLSKRAVIVASSGNRPAADATVMSDLATPAPGQDAAEEVFPAGYDEVLAVSATASGTGSDDPSAYVVPNSQTDVAVPTAMAVSYGLNGLSCTLPDVATSWAAGVVGGVMAVLRARYRKDTPEQLIARIKTTAAGAADQPTLYAGAGTVQPVEALTRRLSISPAGVVDEAHVEERAETPLRLAPEDPDPLAGLRRDLVWWGLLAGGVLGLAALLRPLLQRRRVK